MGYVARRVGSPPGLLYYLTRRIAEAGGLPLSDFRADPRIEYPETTDVPRGLGLPAVRRCLAAWNGRSWPRRSTR
jgi:hypothetical protein